MKIQQVIRRRKTTEEMFGVRQGARIRFFFKVIGPGEIIEETFDRALSAKSFYVEFHNITKRCETRCEISNLEDLE